MMLSDVLKCGNFEIYAKKGLPIYDVLLQDHLPRLECQLSILGTNRAHLFKCVALTEHTLAHSRECTKHGINVLL